MARPKLTEPRFRLWLRRGWYYVSWTQDDNGRTVSFACGTADKETAEQFLANLTETPDAHVRLAQGRRESRSLGSPRIGLSGVAVRRPVRSAVYTVANAANDFIKIGHCFGGAGIDNRLRTLQIGSPVKLWVHGSVDFESREAAMAAEGSAHGMFATQRRFGEWFQVDADEVLRFLSRPDVILRLGNLVASRDPAYFNSATE